MARLRHFGQATPVLRYSNWIAAALVTLCAVYLHVLFFLNAGGLWRDEADLVHLSLLPSVSEVWQNLPHDSCPILMHLDDLPGRYARLREWVKHGKIIRPEREQQVFRIRDKRVRQPQRNRELCECAHSASMRLRDGCDNRGRRHESKQRYLFDDKTTNY